MSRTSNYWCRKHFIKIQDRRIFKARDKIKDSITGSLNQELQKSNVSNLSETVPTCREHQTIGVGNISSRFKTVGSNSALFDSCPFWLVKNPRGELGYTPLHYAARNNNMEVCKLIIGQIADKNPINNLGVTPLHYAAENDSLEICQLIIEGLEETNPSDNDGNTPLHCAVRNFSLEICKLLCQNSNNKNPKNDRGKTPLDLAFERKDPKIYRFFKSRASKI